MRHAIRFMPVALVIVAILALGAPAVSANHQQLLSVNHTAYGVSQLLATPLSQVFDLDLANPNHFTHIAAVLFYSRDTGSGNSEVWLGCAVRRLTPHGALGLSSGFAAGTYVEVISAPENRVKMPNGFMIRVGDGLGIKGTSTNIVPRSATTSEVVTRDLGLVHPSMFSLPSDRVVPGQRQAAVDCICNGVAAIAAPSDVFKESFFPFGIGCP